MGDPAFIWDRRSIEKIRTVPTHLCLFRRDTHKSRHFAVPSDMKLLVKDHDLRIVSIKKSKFIWRQKKRHVMDIPISRHIKHRCIYIRNAWRVKREVSAWGYILHVLRLNNIALSSTGTKTLNIWQHLSQTFENRIPFSHGRTANTFDYYHT